ncbi:SipW-dependent-type signal peptide-containing protein, partial [Frigoribacterium sp. CFBP9030]|uniref:SipW-dependent-type signal peptide-containing protein n=1 Tax=Frigoribacterium sp. CFBP9030 TaxID=3096537 RepID=UPI0039C87617
MSRVWFEESGPEPAAAGAPAATAATAAAAGIALLLGGAGTFALWNANTEVAAASVTS